MPFLNDIFSLVNTKRSAQIERFRSNPGEVQNEQLEYLIRKAADTEFGKKFEFSSIKSVQTFKERVAVRDYETIMPEIIRLRQGEKNLLWPGDIKWYAKSSGTTSSRSKFIPVSKDALIKCHFQGGRDTLLIYNELVPNNKIGRAHV